MIPVLKAFALRMGFFNLQEHLSANDTAPQKSHCGIQLRRSILIFPEFNTK